MSQPPARARQFASDTYAGICSEALAALQEANHGHAAAYGDDPWTARAVAALRAVFETSCEVFFVATGTAANALALAALCQSYHSIFCHTDAHVQTDECGAPEYAARGVKLVPLPGAQGKALPDSLHRAVAGRRDVHSHKPGALSLSQATEAGTAYRSVELAALTEAARGLGLRTHMDGARFANALAGQGTTAAELSWRAGIDVLCLGGTKNGLAAGDAILFFNHDLAREFEYRRKQAGHLLAKMRFLAAPWLALLESGAWLRNAAHANRMARLLQEKLRTMPELHIVYPVEANAVFVKMPEHLTERLHQRGWHFYSIAGAYRLMCSWDTQEEDIEAFLQDVRALAGMA